MKKAVSVSLADLNSAVVERSSGRLQAIVVGPTDVKLTGVAPLAVATRSDLAFLANPLYRADALTSQRRCDRAQRGGSRRVAIAVSALDGVVDGDGGV